MRHVANRWLLLSWALVLGASCGDDGPTGSTEGAGGTGAAASTSIGAGASTSSGGMKPPPGPSADGWVSSFEPDAGATGCAAEPVDFEAAGAAAVTVGDSTIYVAFEQIGDNQNPVVARFDGGVAVWCAVHETEGPDGRALGVTWDGGDHAYVVYTVVGGGTSLEGKGGWLASYAPGAISGGGSKVSYIGRVATADGALASGTFVIAVKSDNKVNSHGPAGAVNVLGSGEVEFFGASAHKPIDADGASSMDCTDYPFDSRYRFSADLASFVCADCSNCVSQTPCP